MISLYRPGNGFAHRLPAAVKLAALAGAAVVLSVLRPDPPVAVLIVLGASLLYPAAALPWRVLGAAWWRLRWLILVMGVLLWVFTSPHDAMVNTSRMVSLLLLAELVTVTTRMGDLLDVLRGVLRPLRRVGIDPETVALTLSLAIAMVPVIAGFAAQVRDAQRARGVRLGPRVVLPLLVMTMKHADAVGDALAAREIAR